MQIRQTGILLDYILKSEILVVLVFHEEKAGTFEVNKTLFISQSLETLQRKILSVYIRCAVLGRSVVSDSL